MNKEGKIELTFPDGLKRLFNTGINGIEVAKSISKSLSKEAVAIEVDGIEVDLCDEIMNDSNINILTINNKKGLDIMRHTLTAQVLAKAVKKIYPNSKLAIGPTIENGFYYDFLFEKPISEEDLPKIEKEMKKIISTGAEIKKILKPKKDVIDMFQKRNEDYKVNIIESANQENDFSVYCQENTDFIDLCKGPHLPNLKLIGAFKLTKISGAYWKGDSKNEMLQRIYGTAWKNKKDLDEHLNMLEEAERRDHRLLGKKNGFISFSRRSSGSCFLACKRMEPFSKFNKLHEKKTG